MSSTWSDDRHCAAQEALVSVIIPVFNGEALIGDTIESALRQTWRNLEIIVVDDGSTDRTAEVVQAYADRDSRIRLVRQPNSGVARARNRGLAGARGEFVAPLDADDLWEPTKIEMQVRRMSQDDAIGLVYCWWVWIDEKGTILDRSPAWRVEGNGLPTLLQVNYTGNASVPVYRRSCIQEVGGYDEDLQQQRAWGCEDWDLALKVAARFPVAVVPVVLTGYRRLQGSMSLDVEVMWRSRTLVSDGVRKRTQLPKSLFQGSADQFALYIAGAQFWSGAYFQAVVWTLRSWRSGLLFSVLPYIFRVLWEALRRRSLPHAQVMAPGQALDFSRIPEPLIPYDHIYTHRLAPAAAAPGIQENGTPRDLAFRDRLAAWLRSPLWQAVAVLTAFLVIVAPHFRNDGLWYGGDAPRHAVNGFFWWDLLTSHPSAPMDYARSYWARYPIINPVAYPPLFYLLEGFAFHLFGPFPAVAKCLVLLFGVITGLYTMAWARRWLGPAAGWSGAFVAFTPGVVGLTNAVMLNIPTTAFGLAGLYHFRRWTESGLRKHLIAGILAACAAALTYFQGGIVFCICVAWAILLQRGRVLPFRRLSWIAAAAVPAVIPPMLAIRLTPAFAARHLPTLATLARPATWTFYPANLPTLLGKVVLILGLTGITAGFLAGRWRNETAYLATWIAIPILCFSLLPAKDSRYVLLLAPAFLLAIAIGLDCAFRLLPSRRPELMTALLVLGLAAGCWSALSMRVPVKSGVREVAVYLQEHAPADAVLYDGFNDGLFGYYVRALDPGFLRRVVLAQDLLYHYGPATTFAWVERSKATSTDEVVNIVRTQSGCRWVAIEVGPLSELARGQRLLRQAVTRPDFELVQSFPVNANGTLRIDLYRLVGPVLPVSSINLNYLPFPNRPLESLVPVKR
jgi:hypothetical protein